MDFADYVIGTIILMFVFIYAFNKFYEVVAPRIKKNNDAWLKKHNISTKPH